MLNSALTLPRLLLLVVLGCAGLVWTVAGTRETQRAPTVARVDNPFSMWTMLRRVGCAGPYKNTTFIVGVALPDETGNPYIFECTDSGLSLNGASLQ